MNSLENLSITAIHKYTKDNLDNKNWAAQLEMLPRKHLVALYKDSRIFLNCKLVYTRRPPGMCHCCFGFSEAACVRYNYDPYDSVHLTELYMKTMKRYYEEKPIY